MSLRFKGLWLFIAAGLGVAVFGTLAVLRPWERETPRTQRAAQASEADRRRTIDIRLPDDDRTMPAPPMTAEESARASAVVEELMRAELDRAAAD